MSVLMLGVLLISCATAFSWFVRMQVRALGHERSALTSRSMAHVLARAVMNALNETAKHFSYDSPLQQWYKPFVIQTDDIGLWIVQISPLDDKLPLNMLFLPDGNTLRRELTQTWHDLFDKLGHSELENLILDFLDRNTRARVGSSERDYFINRAPYDISELLILSADISREMFNSISEYCTVYSEGHVNLNTAPVNVLELLPGITGSLAGRIASLRMEKPLQSLRDISSISGAPPNIAAQLTNIASFKSRYCKISIDCLENEGGGNMTFSIIFDRTTRKIAVWEES